MSYGCVILEMQHTQHGSLWGMWYCSSFEGHLS